MLEHVRPFLLSFGLAAACAHTDRDALRRSLLQADEDFDRRVAEHGTEAWVQTFADDGRMFFPNEPVVRGHDAIREAMAALGDPSRSEPGLRVHWKPLFSDVSEDGTLGWTYGNASIRSSKGERRTKYVTVWRKQGDESWKAVADIGVPGDAEPGKGP